MEAKLSTLQEIVNQFSAVSAATIQITQNYFSTPDRKLILRPIFNRAGDDSIEFIEQIDDLSHDSRTKEAELKHTRVVVTS